MIEKQKPKYTVEYKFILIGNTAVGKTLFFKRIQTGIFNEKNISTIGVDRCFLYFKDIDVKIKGKDSKEEFNIILYDTAGQERYRALSKNYFSKTDVIILIYDITNKKTFEDIEKWLDSVDDLLSNRKTGNYIIFLLGNKSDLVGKDYELREVAEEEAKNLCEEKGIYWGGECSMKDFTKEKLSDILLKAWKKYVEKFGIKQNSKMAFRLGNMKKATNKIKC